MKQLEFVFDPSEISFSEAKTQRKECKWKINPYVVIRPRKDGGVGFGFYNLEQFGNIERMTPGIFEKFGVKRLVFRIGDGYKLASPSDAARWFHTRVKAEQYEDFIGKSYLIDTDAAGEYLFITEEVEE